MKGITLTKVQRGVYEATLAGKAAIMAFASRDRQDKSQLNASVTFNPARIKEAERLAKQRGAAPYVATQILLKGKPQMAFAIPLSLWPKLRQGDANFPVGPKAQKAFDQEAKVLSGFTVALEEGTTEVEESPGNGRRRGRAESGEPIAKDMVDAVAKSVAGELLGGATLQLSGMTREDAWDRIHRGVAKATRQIGFRP